MPWTLLGILLAVCAVACAVGFYKFVYFLSISTIPQPPISLSAPLLNATCPAVTATEFTKKPAL